MWWLKLAPWAACAVLGWLWLEARDDVAIAISECNASKLAEIAEAERLVRETVQAAADERAAELARRAIQADDAVAQAKFARDMAEQGTAQREDRIRQLELEASIDDIPDSFECLNVFVPECALERVRDGEDSTQAGDSESAGSSAVCADTGGTDSGDTATAAFSALTYSDVLILWPRDRDSLETVNGQLRAIRGLSDAIEETP